MKRRATVLATGATALLVAGAVAAQAQTGDETPGMGGMQRIHDSEQMREMRDQMPEDMQEWCDNMHEEMSGQMERMMGGMHRQNWEQ
jgi:predicted transcriptional regulator